MATSPNRGAIRWLRDELPALVAGNVITEETATALRHHYAATETRSRNFAFALLAIVGSVLIGAGIILLIAHNWDELSRPTRCLIAFLPLIGTQALGAFVLLRRNDSQAWRETAAILNVAAIATAISLVSQTYQIQGTLDRFMVTWLLLSIPIVYIFQTTLGAIVYVVGTIEWLFAREGLFSSSSGNPLLFWLLLLLVVPYFVLGFRTGRQSSGTTWLGIFLLGASAIGLAFTAEFTKANLCSLSFAGLFAGAYMFGTEFLRRPEQGRLHPIALLAGIGIGVTAIVLSFDTMWRITGIPSVNAPGSIAIGVQLLFPVIALLLYAERLLRARPVNFSVVAAAFPLVVATCWMIAWARPRGSSWQNTQCDFIAAVIMSLYALALGVEFLARGIRSLSIVRTNFGLALIAALAVARFFDSDLSFVTRGIAFIVLGLGFLGTNVVLFKRRSLP